MRGQREGVAPGADASDGAPDVWRRPGPLGIYKATAGLGGVAAPLFAGFALTTVALLITTEQAKRPQLSEWCVAAFAISAGLLIFAIQFTSLASAYASTPSERLDWTPEATVDPVALQTLREKQAKDDKLSGRLLDRAARCYEFGLMAFLVGLTLLVVPAHWTVLTTLPVAVGALATAVEIAWAPARRLAPGNWLRRVIVPTRADISLTEKEKVSDLDDRMKLSIMKEDALSDHSSGAAVAQTTNRVPGGQT